MRLRKGTSCTFSESHNQNLNFATFSSKTQFWSPILTGLKNNSHENSVNIVHVHDFGATIWRHHRVPWPRFPIKRANFGDSWTFKADIAFFIFAWVFRTSGSKIRVLRGKIGEGVGWYWPTKNSFLLLEVYMFVSNLVKIDEEMRPWDGPQTDRHTHRRETILLSVPCYHGLYGSTFCCKSQ